MNEWIEFHTNKGDTYKEEKYRFRIVENFPVFQTLVSKLVQSLFA